MKIVFLADALDVQYAGIHVYCKNLLQAINLLQSQHQIYVIRSSTEKQFPNLIEIAIPIKSKFPLHQRIRQFTSIPKYLNQLKPDVVIETAHFGPFRLHSSIKRVTFIHDLSPILFPQWHPFSSFVAHKLLLKSTLCKADLILTNSAFTKSEIHKEYPQINTPVEVTKLSSSYNEDTGPDEFVFEKHTIQLPYFLFVGTLEPRKNLSVLLKAYDAFRKSHPEKKTGLVLAGKMGWKQKKLLSEIKNLTYSSDLIMTGFVSDSEKKALFQNALALIYPSLYEGFGLPVLEAMSNACPVICSKTSALPEAGGSAALYFSPGDVSALKKHLLTVSKPNHKAENAKKLTTQAQQFSWRKTALETLHFIEALGS